MSTSSAVVSTPTLGLGTGKGCSGVPKFGCTGETGGSKLGFWGTVRFGCTGETGGRNLGCWGVVRLGVTGEAGGLVLGSGKAMSPSPVSRRNLGSTVGG